MKKNLFLDDLRNPQDVFYYKPLNCYLMADWSIVRSYEEFVCFIEDYYKEYKELPLLISFDHDLAPEHYVPEEYWYPIEKSEEYQSLIKYTEKTGLDCAKWLVNFCIDNNLDIPNYHIHSMNPVGKANIYSYINNYLKNLNE